MPKCEGPPNNECPFNRSGNKVALCQGDLMLCSHCNNIRFPNSYHPKGASVHKVHHSQGELPWNCEQAQGISDEKEEMTEPNDPSTTHCVKDLTELN